MLENRTYGGHTGVLYKGVPTGSVCSSGYYTFRAKGKTYRNHRYVWELHHGPTDLHIDHINGNKLDNRIENLRAVTQKANNQNVSHARPRKHGKVWRIRMKFNGVQHTASGFQTEGDAAEFATLLSETLKGEFHRE